MIQSRKLGRFVFSVPFIEMLTEDSRLRAIWCAVFRDAIVIDIRHNYAACTVEYHVWHPLLEIVPLYVAPPEYFVRLTSTGDDAFICRPR